MHIAIPPLIQIIQRVHPFKKMNAIEKKIQEIPLEEQQNRLFELDDHLAEMLKAESVGTIIEQIGAKYGLATTLISDLKNLILFFVLRLISSQDFVNLLATFPIPQKFFNAFRQELEQKLWSPYDRFLLDAGLVYKQLAILDPQPIEQEATTQAAPTTPNAQTISVSVTPTAQQTAPQQPQPKPFIDTFFAPKPTGPQPIEIKTTPVGAAPQPIITKPIVPPPQSATTQSDEARVKFAPARTPIAHMPEPVFQKPATQEPQLNGIRFTPAPSHQAGLEQRLAPQQPIPAPVQTPEQKPTQQAHGKPIQQAHGKPIQQTATPTQQPKPAMEPLKTVIDLSTFGITPVPSQTVQGLDSKTPNNKHAADVNPMELHQT